MPAAGPLRPAGAGPATRLPAIEPAEPVSTYPEDRGAAGAERDTEPALPDEARARAATEARSPTDAIEAGGTSSVLHIRFGAAPAAQLVSAMEVVRQLVRERPGDTPVVVYVPAPGGALPMELRTRVAYDAELMAEVQRRLGQGIVSLHLA